MKLIVHWFLSALAIMITAFLLPGIILKGFFAALIVSIVLGFFNTIIRPILILLSLPIQFLTLGLFTFAINAGLVMLTSRIVEGFHVENFGWALLFSLVLWAVNATLHHFDPNDKA
ncbi:MAG: hypothetical protein ACD_56C00141G0001 [uncultured bacterium]|nr:MAG: hypothetical protein ACD_56C00141G0001 [uncultured bacterium]